MNNLKTLEDYINEQAKAKEYKNQWLNEDMNPLDIDIAYKSVYTYSLAKANNEYPDLHDATYQTLFIKTWNILEQSKFMESLILRIPTTPIWVAELSDHKFIILDGHERIETIRSFLNDDQTFTGWEYLKEYNYKHYSDLPKYLQRRIEETDFRVNIIRIGTPLSIVYNILSRINPKYLWVDTNQKSYI